MKIVRIKILDQILCVDKTGFLRPGHIAINIVYNYNKEYTNPL